MRYEFFRALSTLRFKSSVVRRRILSNSAAYGQNHAAAAAFGGVGNYFCAGLEILHIRQSTSKFWHYLELHDFL